MPLMEFLYGILSYFMFGIILAANAANLFCRRYYICPEYTWARGYNTILTLTHTLKLDQSNCI